MTFLPYNPPELTLLSLQLFFNILVIQFNSLQNINVGKKFNLATKNNSKVSSGVWAHPFSLAATCGIMGSSQK